MICPNCGTEVSIRTGVKAKSSGLSCPTCKAKNGHKPDCAANAENLRRLRYWSFLKRRGLFYYPPNVDTNGHVIAFMPPMPPERNGRA